MKIKGYGSIILIVFIGFISILVSYIGINLYQNSLIINNKKDNIQSKYIAESYLYNKIEEIKVDKLNGSINLFSDLDHTNSITINEINFNDIPSYKIDVNVKYKDIESNARGVVSKYNRIFYLEDGLIMEDRVPNYCKKPFIDFKNSIVNGIKYSNKHEIIELNDSLIVSKNGAYIAESLEDEVILLNFIQKTCNFIIPGNVEIGAYPYLNNIKLTGTYYIEGNINLNTNLILQGIVISNNGSITTNGYACKIDGILIELGDSGSYGSVEIIHNNSIINSYIEHILNAKYTEELSIIINK